jgi:NAD(P)-dependent dehydrogenase (short-subunit alcohol dehydrogenase family)
MKQIVITGSTRGIGYGLAREFLEAGCAVTVSGRTPASVDRAVTALTAKYGRDRLHGCPCDVTELAQVESLWQSAVAQFGRVDIWINNAGIAHALVPAWELAPQLLASVVETNVIGLAYGSRVAIRGMLAQGQGQLYNMLGQGANGNTRHGMSVYGMTKAAANHLARALIDELEGKPVQVGTLSPGMVMTDMLLDQIQSDPELLTRGRRIFNILADRVETVTPWLVRRILANDRTGVHIRWLTQPKIIWRFLSAPFRRRDLFEMVE